MTGGNGHRMPPTLIPDVRVDDDLHDVLAGRERGAVGAVRSGGDGQVRSDHVDETRQRLPGVVADVSIEHAEVSIGRRRARDRGREGTADNVAATEMTRRGC